MGGHRVARVLLELALHDNAQSPRFPRKEGLPRIERSGCYSPSIERLVSTYRHCYSLCISAGGLLRKWCPVAIDRSRLTIGWSARV